MISLAIVSVASAHHSSTASYEADASITIKGKVVEFAWTNPHGHVYVRVTEGPFTGQTYGVELSSPNVLLTDAAAAQHHFDALAGLVSQCTCYRLDTGRDLDDAVAVIRRAMAA